MIGRKETVRFYDTNTLLGDINAIEGKVYLSSVTLQELEDIKVSGRKDEGVKFSARVTTRWLSENEDSYECVVVEDKHYKLLKKLKLDTSPDNLIMACAYLLDRNCTFVTNDMCCYNVAKSVFKLNVEKSNGKKTDYKGYIEKHMTTQEFTTMYEMYNRGHNAFGLQENQYLIVVLSDDEDKAIEYRYRQGILCDLELPNKIKGLSSKQRCAIDLLYDTSVPIKVVAGVYGSGKTYLAVRVGINGINKSGDYSKMMIVRQPTGAGESVGFLPGTQEEKTADFYAPITDNLDGGEQELETLKMQGKIETQIPFYIKGRSIPNTYIIVDEAEDLTVKEFKLIGSRIARNSSVVFTGDWKQAENKYTYDNGLKKFIEYIGEHPSEMVGVVVLDDDVRSEASKYFVDFE